LSTALQRAPQSCRFRSVGWPFTGPRLETGDWDRQDHGRTKPVPRFRSSWIVAAISCTNLGSKGALETLWIL